jgi:hypothetical protein
MRPLPAGWPSRRQIVASPSNRSFAGSGSAMLSFFSVRSIVTPMPRRALR